MSSGTSTYEEHRRDVYEKILLASTKQEKIKLAEQFNGPETKALRLWYRLSQGETIDSWPEEDRNMLEGLGRMYESELRDIDLLLEYERADTEPRQAAVAKKIQKRLGIRIDRKFQDFTSL